MPRFPSTRFQGSKRKILPELARAFSSLDFETCLDLYAGSGSVSLLLRLLGKKTDANDYLAYSRLAATVFLNVEGINLDLNVCRNDFKFLLEQQPTGKFDLVSSKFSNVFYTKEENDQIDRFCGNIDSMSSEKKDLYIYCMGQAMLMKRPYNLFHRANLDMRLRDVSRSFGNKKTWETPFIQHCTKTFAELAAFPFPSRSYNAKIFGQNTRNLGTLPNSYDLIYIDPPYAKKNGTSTNYVDFYHFLDGLIDYSLFDEGNSEYPHRPIVRHTSAWNSRTESLEELQRITDHWKNSILFFSYRSEGFPSPAQAREILSTSNRKVEVQNCGDYKYALSHDQENQELFFISRP